MPMADFKYSKFVEQLKIKFVAKHKYDKQNEMTFKVTAVMYYFSKHKLCF